MDKWIAAMKNSSLRKQKNNNNKKKKKKKKKKQEETRRNKKQETRNKKQETTNKTFRKAIFSSPLLELSNIILDLNSTAGGAQVFAQQKVVEGVGVDVEEDLAENWED
jgi:ATPase subunit of ABC transporter with duplicated ATPase domains